MIELHHIDCMEYMKVCEDNCFDLAIVDPPYGILISKMNLGTGKGKRHSKIENRKWGKKDWDDSPPKSCYFDEIYRISKNQIIWGGNHFEIPSCYGYVIWDKKMTPGLPFADCEFAWHSFRKAPKIFRYSTFLGKKDKFHPTQKPVKLYEWLLKNYAKEGDRILDTHLGSGSIAIACHNKGFDLVGCELDKEYYEGAKKRLSEHQKQLQINFEPRSIPDRLF